MAIRIEHSASPAAVGMAAFAAGRGKARQRQQKYSFDLARDQQRIQSRQQGLKYRAVAGGARQQRLQQNPFGQQAAGEWSDPLVGASGQDAVQIRSQQEANARARRLGKPEPSPGIDPIFTPAPTRDEIRRGQVLFDEDRERQQQLDDVAATRTVAGRKARATSLRSLMPDFDVDPAISGQLNQDLAEIEAALNGNQVDFNDPGQAAAVEEKIEAFKATVAGLRPPDPNALGLVLDEETQRYRSPREGERATHIGGPGEFPQPIPEIAAQEEAKVAAAAEAAEKQADQAQKDADYKRGRIDKLQDKIDELRGKDKPPAKQIKAIEARITKLQEEPAAKPDVGGGTPIAGGGSSGLAPTMGPHGAMVGPSREAVEAQYEKEIRERGQATPETQRAYESFGEGGAQQKPLPAGVPAGAKRIDENTIQLPNGQILRRKRGG